MRKALVYCLLFEIMFVICLTSVLPVSLGHDVLHDRLILKHTRVILLCAPLHIIKLLNVLLFFLLMLLFQSYKLVSFKSFHIWLLFFLNVRQFALNHLSSILFTKCRRLI